MTAKFPGSSGAASSLRNSSRPLREAIQFQRRLHLLFSFHARRLLTRIFYDEVWRRGKGRGEFVLWIGASAKVIRRDCVEIGVMEICVISVVELIHYYCRKIYFLIIKVDLIFLFKMMNFDKFK